jgi:hypothetical protein
VKLKDLGWNSFHLIMKSKIMLMNSRYWKLSETSMLRPRIPIKCLPSDCRYREDSIAQRNNDLELSAKEKERLEELQRADRRLREKAEKIRKEIRRHIYGS